MTKEEAVRASRPFNALHVLPPSFLDTFVLSNLSYIPASLHFLVYQKIHPKQYQTVCLGNEPLGMSCFIVPSPSTGTANCGL